VIELAGRLGRQLRVRIVVRIARLVAHRHARESNGDDFDSLDERQRKYCVGFGGALGPDKDRARILPKDILPDRVDVCRKIPVAATSLGASRYLELQSSNSRLLVTSEDGLQLSLTVTDRLAVLILLVLGDRPRNVSPNLEDDGFIGPPVGTEQRNEHQITAASPQVVESRVRVAIFLQRIHLLRGPRERVNPANVRHILGVGSAAEVTGVLGGDPGRAVRPGRIEELTHIEGAIRNEARQIAFFVLGSDTSVSFGSLQIRNKLACNAGMVEDREPRRSRFGDVHWQLSSFPVLAELPMRHVAHFTASQNWEQIPLGPG
jgi:hypothetical protein